MSNPDYPWFSNKIAFNNKIGYYIAMERQEFIDLLLQLGFTESNLTGKTWPKFMSIGRFESCKNSTPLQQLVNYWRFDNDYILVEHPTPFLIPEGINFHLWEDGLREYSIKHLIYSDSVTIRTLQPPQETISLYNTQFAFYKISLIKEYQKDEDWNNIYSYVKDFKSLLKVMITSKLENIEYVNLNLQTTLKENPELTRMYNIFKNKDN